MHKDGFIWRQEDTERNKPLLQDAVSLWVSLLEEITVNASTNAASVNMPT